MKISLLVPSRARPDALAEAVASAYDTLTGFPDMLEVVARLDDDDPLVGEYQPVPGITIVGPRIVLSAAWNECWKLATGEILMLFADDVRFRTHGWDVAVRDAFASVPDRIAVVYGRDGHVDRPTHPFVHRHWVEAVGRFTHAGFTADYVDTWYEELATQLDRRRFLPDVLIEHMHYSFGKADIDGVAVERNERAKQWPRPCDVWDATAEDRVRDAAILRELMTP